MKKLFLLLPVLFLTACDNNPAVVCKNDRLYIQVGMNGSVYERTNTICIDTKLEELKK